MFDNVVYLNRDQDVERREITEKQFLNLGVSAHRFSAITESIEDYCHQTPEELRISKPQLSCLISHLEIIRTYGDKDILVFEDDINIAPYEYWGFSFKDLIDAMPAFVGCLQLFTFPAPASNIVKKWVPGLFGTAAYFLKKEYASRLVELGYIDGKWDISKMPNRYSQPLADSVLYSHDGSYSIVLFGIRNETSTILPHATYGQTASLVTEHLISNPPSLKAIKDSVS